MLQTASSGTRLSASEHQSRMQDVYGTILRASAHTVPEGPSALLLDRASERSTVLGGEGRGGAGRGGAARRGAAVRSAECDLTGFLV